MTKTLNSNNQFEIQKYLFHKKTFNIRSNIYLEQFEALLNSSQKYSLERSCKIAGNNLFPARFIVFFTGQNPAKPLNLVFDFFKNLEQCPKVKLNRSILDKVFNNKFDLDKLYQVIAGIDYRDNLAACRAKIFFKIADYPDKFAQVLSLHGYNEMLLDLIAHDCLLFGVDLFFNGKTNIKIYLHFDRDDLSSASVQKKIEKYFSDKVISLIKKSRSFHLTFKGKGLQNIFDFYPENRNSFIRQLRNDKLIEIDNKMKSPLYGKTGLVSLLEQEINKGRIETANLYID